MALAERCSVSEFVGEKVIVGVLDALQVHIQGSNIDQPDLANFDAFDFTLAHQPSEV